MVQEPTLSSKKCHSTVGFESKFVSFVISQRIRKTSQEIPRERRVRLEEDFVLIIPHYEKNSTQFNICRKSIQITAYLLTYMEKKSWMYE